jgi:F0F1-type ATP synthase membrane subunit b/b'
MIKSWWDAHELEVLIGAVLLMLIAMTWLWFALGAAYRERKQKKKDGLL